MWDWGRYFRSWVSCSSRSANLSEPGSICSLGRVYGFLTYPVPGCILSAPVNFYLFLRRPNAFIYSYRSHPWHVRCPQDRWMTFCWIKFSLFLSRTLRPHRPVSCWQLLSLRRGWLGGSRANGKIGRFWRCGLIDILGTCHAGDHTSLDYLHQVFYVLHFAFG